MYKLVITGPLNREHLNIYMSNYYYYYYYYDYDNDNDNDYYYYY